jgi:hypothetical protein
VFSFAGFLYFGLGIVSGALADRWGARRLAVLGMTLVGLGMVLAGQAQTILQVFAAYSIGIGAGVVDRMRELGLPVRGVNVGESPATDRDRYMRLRDELWWLARAWFEGRDVVIPPDQGLIAELVSPKYKIESSGKIKIESKDDMRKRGVKSPNKADALCLTFAGGDLAIETLTRMGTAQTAYDPFAVGSDDYDRGLAIDLERRANSMLYDPMGF